LDEECAKEFARLGVSRVSVSIDSMEAELHDSFRGHKSAWQKAIDALKYVKEAGMEPYLNITVGHYNAFDEDIEKLCEYSKEQGYTTLVNVAVPSGNWHSMDDVMCDEKDTAHLIKLRKKYKNMLRNLWNPFDKKYEGVIGCNTVNRTYITPIGDVLVCPYVHIKIGNIFEQSLKEIVEYGHSIKHFNNHNPLCMAGEDKEFVNKYLKTPGIGVFKPLEAKEIFKDEDYVKE
jgi:MoaA/NifB/PqqE/SkfB family radical SAM enzyme